MKCWNAAKMTPSSSGDERCAPQWPLPWPLWLTSLAAMTLLMTVWRKSFSPATLGEKREMFSCLWRMASSNASLEFTHDRQHANGEEKRREREKKSSIHREPDKSGHEKKRWMKKARGRERGKTPNSDTDTMTGTKAILLANSNAGWVTGETQRDAVISEIPSSHTNTDEAAASIKTQILLSCLNNDQTSQTHDTELQQ